MSRTCVTALRCVGCPRLVSDARPHRWVEGLASISMLPQISLDDLDSDRCRRARPEAAALHDHGDRGLLSGSGRAEGHPRLCPPGVMPPPLPSAPPPAALP